MDKIIQLLPADGTYFLSENFFSGLMDRQAQTRTYRVVAWALIERNGQTLVIPMILGERGLIFLPSEANWKITRQV